MNVYVRQNVLHPSVSCVVRTYHLRLASHSPHHLFKITILFQFCYLCSSKKYVGKGDGEDESWQSKNLSSVPRTHTKMLVMMAQAYNLCAREVETGGPRAS